MAISRGQLVKELEPGLNALFGLEYKRYENQHAQIFDSENSDRAFEEEVMLSGFANAQTKPEGSAVTFDNAQETFTSRYTHETIALAFSITEEAIEDNLYDRLASRYTKALARSMANTKQVKAANVFNNAFDNRNTVIINKEAMKVLKFQNAEDAIDKFIKWNGRLIKVIGVVDDFHQESFHKIIEPIVLYEQGFDQYVDYISIKFNRYNPDKHLPIIKKTFNAAFPGQSFDYFFLNDFFNKQYKTDINSGKLISGFASLAILIAVLGLFNLISFSVAKRTKEIGIRKVIGASTISILFLLTKDFIRLILIANLIAFPVAYYFMNKWLQDFAYRINMNWWVFILAGCVALAIALITVSFQAIKAAMANPVRSLRYE